jgi:hypothetical protein
MKAPSILNLFTKAAQVAAPIAAAGRKTSNATGFWDSLKASVEKLFSSPNPETAASDKSQTRKVFGQPVAQSLTAKNPEQPKEPEIARSRAKSSEKETPATDTERPKPVEVRVNAAAAASVMSVPVARIAEDVSRKDEAFGTSRPVHVSGKPVESPEPAAQSMLKVETKPAPMNTFVAHAVPTNYGTSATREEKVVGPSQPILRTNEVKPAEVQPSAVPDRAPQAAPVANPIQTTNGSATVKAADASAKTVAASSPANQILSQTVKVLREIQNFWRSHLGNAESKQPASKTDKPRPYVPPKTTETIPEQRLSQVRASLRDAEKMPDKPGPERRAVTPGQAETRPIQATQPLMRNPVVREVEASIVQPREATQPQTRTTVVTPAVASVDDTRSRVDRVPSKPVELQRSVSPATSANPLPAESLMASAPADRVAKTEHTPVAPRETTPVKSDTNRLGGTEKEVVRFSQVKTEDTSPPRSFWGMKVVKETAVTAPPQITLVEPTGTMLERNVPTEAKARPVEKNAAAPSKPEMVTRSAESTAIPRAAQPGRASETSVTHLTPRPSDTRVPREPVIFAPAGKTENSGPRKMSDLNPREVTRNVETNPAPRPQVRNADVRPESFVSAPPAKMTESKPPVATSPVQKPNVAPQATQTPIVAPPATQTPTARPIPAATTELPREVKRVDQPSGDSTLPRTAEPARRIVNPRATDAVPVGKDTTTARPMPFAAAIPSTQVRSRSAVELPEMMPMKPREEVVTARETPTAPQKSSVSTDTAAPTAPRPVQNGSTTLPKAAADARIHDLKPLQAAPKSPEAPSAPKADALPGKQAEFSRVVEAQQPYVRMPDAVPVRETPSKQATVSDTPPVNTPTADREQPTAANAAQILRETQQPLTPSTQPLRPHLTLDQIKELQDMVSRAMSQTRVNLEGASEATFNWSPEGLGSMRFRITSSKDDVRIEIASNRKDVADMLEAGRGTIERMIGDLGLKVERFDVKMKMEADPRETPGQSYEHRHQQQNPQTPESQPGGMIGGGDLAAEPEPVTRKPLVPDHEWLA